MNECIFCRIVAGEIPSSRLYEDEVCLAILDIQPVNPGHVLVLPKQHAEFLGELPDATSSRLMVVANKINWALRKSGLRCEGVNLFLADGEAAFQEVPHTHLHVFPRFKDDGFGLTFSDAYSTLKPTRAELDQIASQIRKGAEEDDGRGD